MICKLAKGRGAPNEDDRSAARGYTAREWPRDVNTEIRVIKAILCVSPVKID